MGFHPLLLGMRHAKRYKRSEAGLSVQARESMTTKQNYPSEECEVAIIDIARCNT